MDRHLNLCSTHIIMFSMVFLRSFGLPRLLRSVRAALSRLGQSPSEATTAASAEKPLVSSGPLPVVDVVDASTADSLQSCRRQELMAQHWQRRCEAAEEMASERQSELGQAQLRYKLELEVALRHKAWCFVGA